MSESTENTYNNVEPCTLASPSHLSTVSEESHDAEEALTCSSSSTNEVSEPLEVKNRRCFSKDELLACNSGRAATEEERKRKILELFKMPPEKLDNSLTREGLFDPERQVITAEPYMYKPHIHPPQPPAASSSASRSGVQPLMQLTPLVLAPARSFKPKPWSPPGLNCQEGSASAAAEGSGSSRAKLRAEPLSSALGKRATPVLAMTPKRFVACFRSGTTGRASKNAPESRSKGATGAAKSRESRSERDSTLIVKQFKQPSHQADASDRTTADDTRDAGERSSPPPEEDLTVFAQDYQQYIQPLFSSSPLLSVSYLYCSLSPVSIPASTRTYRALHEEASAPPTPAQPANARIASKRSGSFSEEEGTSEAIARKMVLVDVESPAATDELVRLEREERRRPQLLERAKALAAIASASASASEEPSVAPTTTTTATEATDVTNAEVSRASGSVAVLHEREPALPVPSSRPLDKQLVQVMSHLMQSSVLHGATMHSTSVKNQAHQWPAHHSKSHQLPPRLLNAAAASAAAAAASSSGVEAIARESRSVEEIEAELLGKWVNRPGAGLPGLDSKQLIGRQVLPLHAFIRALRHENAEPSGEEHFSARQPTPTSLSTTFLEQVIGQGTEAESSLFGCNCGDPSCTSSASAVESKMASLSLSASAQPQPPPPTQRGPLADNSNVNMGVAPSTGRLPAQEKTRAPSFMPWAMQANASYPKAQRDSQSSDRFKPWLSAFSHELPELRQLGNSLEQHKSTRGGSCRTASWFGNPSRTHHVPEAQPHPAGPSRAHSHAPTYSTEREFAWWPTHQHQSQKPLQQSSFVVPSFVPSFVPRSVLEPHLRSFAAVNTLSATAATLIEARFNSGNYNANALKASLPREQLVPNTLLPGVSSSLIRNENAKHLEEKLVLSETRSEMVPASKSEAASGSMGQRSWGTCSENLVEVLTGESLGSVRVLPSDESRRSSAGSGSSFENIGPSPSPSSVPYAL